MGEYRTQMKTALDFNQTKNEINDLKQKIFMLEQQVETVQAENEKLQLENSGMQRLNCIDLIFHRDTVVPQTIQNLKEYKFCNNV